LKALDYNAVMRAVLLKVTDEELAHRRLVGLDRWDEMWDGVLHMTPAPSLEHQRILDEMIAFFTVRLRATGRGRLISGINVFGAETNYRIPDLTFVAAGREHVLHKDGVREGGPDAVIEIRSPDDESYEKFPFYAALGTREVIVIDRDTKRPEIYRLAGSQFVALQQDADGWLRADTLAVRFRAIEGPPPRLRIEDAIDSSLHVEI
jgi:Uma2 family endonuclease